MLRTRWRKVLLDLVGNRARTALVVAAIAVGVFAVGLIATGQAILLRELDREYRSLNAAAATLVAEPFDADLAESMADVPGVAAAEARRAVRLRVNVGPDQWRDLVLTALPDYDDIRLDKIQFDDGRWPPGKRQLLVERLSLEYMNAAVGQSVLVELPDGTRRELDVVGLVHDGSVPAAEIIDSAFGYVSIDTIEWLGQGRAFNEMRITVAENGDDEGHIRRVAAAVEDKMEKSGHAVFWTTVPKPGEHWAEEIIETLVLLLGVFGVLTLFLSGFLVVNTISALLSQHVRQIGVMKLVGARRPQIMSMYFVTVLAFGLLALAIGMPLGILAAQYLVADFVAGLLNFEVTSLAVPPSVLALQAAVGLLVPLLAALWPVISGVRVTTHQALNSVGISPGGYGQGLVDRFFVHLQELVAVQRPLIISLRNTVRRKGRLALTLVTLVLGTALFIAVLSVRSSIQLTLDDFLRYHRYDVSISFSRPYRTVQLVRLAAQIPDVVAVEGWTTTGARRIRPDGGDGASATLWAVPADSAMMAPQVEDGRWLEPGEEQAIVVNTDFADAEPDVAIGSEVVLDVNGRERSWRVVGLVRGTARGGVAYVAYDDYARIAGQMGQANSIRVIAAEHSPAAQARLATALAERFQADGFRVTGTDTTAAIRQQLDFQFNIVLGFLVLMAVLLAVVGGLGLTTTMSINVLERRREIGVLRAIGASDWAVRRIVLAEGVLIGWLSFAAGGLLALPFSQILSRQVGMALLGAPLSYMFSTGGLLLWFIVISALATAASLGPARSASRLTIREVLAYE